MNPLRDELRQMSRKPCIQPEDINAAKRLHLLKTSLNSRQSDRFEAALRRAIGYAESTGYTPPLRHTFVLRARRKTEDLSYETVFENRDSHRCGTGGRDFGGTGTGAGAESTGREVSIQR